MVMYGNANCILYFKQIINTHVKKLCFSPPATITAPGDGDDIAEPTDMSR